MSKSKGGNKCTTLLLAADTPVCMCLNIKRIIFVNIIMSNSDVHRYVRGNKIF